MFMYDYIFKEGASQSQFLDIISLPQDIFFLALNFKVGFVSISCCSDSLLPNVGELIGPDGSSGLLVIHINYIRLCELCIKNPVNPVNRGCTPAAYTFAKWRDEEGQHWPGIITSSQV